MNSWGYIGIGSVILVIGGCLAYAGLVLDSSATALLYAGSGLLGLAGGMLVSIGVIAEGVRVGNDSSTS